MQVDFGGVWDTVLWTKNWNAQHWHLDHHILFAKLEDYGIHDVALQWFKSYFSCHQQFVQFNQACSPMQTIKCGIPQGSISGLSRSCTAHKSTHDVLTIPGFNNEKLQNNWPHDSCGVCVVCPQKPPSFTILFCLLLEFHLPIIWIPNVISGCNARQSR